MRWCWSSYGRRACGHCRSLVARQMLLWLLATLAVGGSAKKPLRSLPHKRALHSRLVADELKSGTRSAARPLVRTESRPESSLEAHAKATSWQSALNLSELTHQPGHVSKWCENGIIDDDGKPPEDGKACCAATCGRCEEVKCTERNGGESHCCPTKIIGRSKLCEDHFSTVCVVGDKPPIARAAAAPIENEVDPNDKCNEAAWPDTKLLGDKHICGDCKVIVDKFDTEYKNCDGYCKALGTNCTGAWEETGNECAVEREMTCDQEEETSDAICECAPPTDPLYAHGTSASPQVRSDSKNGRPALEAVALKDLKKSDADEDYTDDWEEQLKSSGNSTAEVEEASLSTEKKALLATAFGFLCLIFVVFLCFKTYAAAPALDEPAANYQDDDVIPIFADMDDEGSTKIRKK